MHDKLYSYQAEGARWLADTGDALLAWDMGTGKTATSVHATELVNARRIVVVCPAVAKSVWRDAFTRWSKIKLPIRVIHSATSPVGGGEGVWIVSYDLMSRAKQNGLIRRLSVEAIDVLICDEAHALKTRSASRTMAIYGPKADRTGLAGHAKRVWLLTGTPVLNHANELWTHLHALAPKTIELQPGLPMPEYRFMERYCKLVATPFGNKITGSQNQQELAARIAPFVSWKRKEEVLKELPPITFDTLPVSVHDAHVSADVLREFKKAEQDATGVYTEVDPENADEFLANLRGSALFLATQRRLTGLLKAPVVAQIVKNDLDGGDGKVIVFCQHTAVIDTLADALDEFNPAMIDGRTSRFGRDAAVNRFQQDPACRVFIGQLQAASTAITLTAASNVIFAEADWTPAINAQAAARAHRIGQPSAVTARFVMLEGTLDAMVMKTLARKAADIAALTQELV